MTDPPSAFYAKIVTFPALIKKSTMCNKRATFSDSNDDIEHSCITELSIPL